MKVTLFCSERITSQLVMLRSISVTFIYPMFCTVAVRLVPLRNSLKVKFK